MVWNGSGMIMGRWCMPGPWVLDHSIAPMILDSGIVHDLP